MEQKTMVIDANGATLGRLASFAAKQALLGKELVIVHCDEVVITGRRASIIEEYKQARKRGGSSLRGPHFPKSPERIVKRTIRGMLDYKQGRGRAALKRITCYNDIPEKYKEVKKSIVVQEKKLKTLTLKELNKEL